MYGTQKYLKENQLLSEVTDSYHMEICDGEGTL